MLNGKGGYYFYTCTSCNFVKKDMSPLENPRCPRCKKRMVRSTKKEKAIITK